MSSNITIVKVFKELVDAQDNSFNKLIKRQYKAIKETLNMSNHPIIKDGK